jgi:hypothetical protein
MTESRGLYIYTSDIQHGVILQYRFKRFPAPRDPSHAMESYYALYDFAVFVDADEPVPDQLQKLDFEEFAKLLAPLPHLQSVDLTQRIAGNPFDTNEDFANWKVYDPKTKSSSMSTASTISSSKLVESEL